jgi:hypothetical protein
MPFSEIKQTDSPTSFPSAATEAGGTKLVCLDEFIHHKLHMKWPADVFWTALWQLVHFDASINCQ